MTNIAEPLSKLPGLPQRTPLGHKGTFGTVMIIGGHSVGPDGGLVMGGAPALAGRAALRSGAGLARIAVPADLAGSVLSACPSATVLALPQNHESGEILPSLSAELLDEHLVHVNSLAIGPGWGVGFPQQQVLVRLIASGHKPVVLDADGLNNLASVVDFPGEIRCPLILTPHPREFARLAGALGWEGVRAEPQTQEERTDAAAELARRLGCIVVLKGAQTVVTDGHEIWVSPFVNSALATAGTGDVLTGIAASLVGQWYSPRVSTSRTNDETGLSLLHCAAWSVGLHGLAAELWREQHGDAGLLAAELADLVPDALQRARTMMRAHESQGRS